MKKYVWLIFALLAIAVAVGCTDSNNGTGSSGQGSSSSGASSSQGGSSSEGGEHKLAAGTYRGSYLDAGENQVTVEFTLKENKVEAIKYRDLRYKDVDYLADNADPTTKAIAGQYQQLIEHLKGKDILTELEKLYSPGEVAEDIEGFASATLRSGKVISAIRDGLNRGLYSLPE